MTYLEIALFSIPNFLGTVILLLIIILGTCLGISTIISAYKWPRAER